MRRLFPETREDMTPEQRAELKAYWLSVLGERPKIDFNAPVEPYMPEAPKCSCGDLGVIKYDVPVDDPRFGKLFPCPDCDKGRETTMNQWARKYQLSELPRQFRGFTFQSWDAIHEEMKFGKWIAYHAALQFVQNPGHEVDLYAIHQELNIPWDEMRNPEPKNSLVFYGDFGTGKSGLMASAVNELLARGVTCLYMRVADLIEDVQDTYRQDSEQSTRDVLQKYKTVPVLFIDEFNIHKTSADKLDKIEQIIRYRYNNILPTLMTMNIDQEQFKAMWSDRAGVAAVAMAHWVLVDHPVLRRADAPVVEERWYQR